MPLKLTYYYRLQKDVVDYAAVLGHLDTVLKTFLMAGDCSKFYIGITGALEERRRQHERDKPEFTLMCVIYSEMANIVADSDFQNLEARAIARFRQGVTNPQTGQRLICANSAGGSLAKRWLYVLVDKRNVAGVPYKRPDDIWADDR